MDENLHCQKWGKGKKSKDRLERRKEGKRDKHEKRSHTNEMAQKQQL